MHKKLKTPESLPISLLMNIIDLAYYNFSKEDVNKYLATILYRFYEANLIDYDTLYAWG